jgi:hypothetical protein
MRRPDLFIVGAPKCGTTALYAYLRRHPEIFMSPLKEPHFFGSDLVFADRPPLSEQEYLGFFAGARDHRLAGEASIWYLYSTRAAAEIKAFSPRARILVMLRNPVDVMHALHTERRFQGSEPISEFAAALAAEPARRRGLDRPHRGMQDAGLYRSVVRFADQLARYLDVFGRDRVHVIIFDDLRADAVAVGRAALEFLGVARDGAGPIGTENAHRGVRSSRLARAFHEPPRAVKWLGRTILNRPARAAILARLRQLNGRAMPRASIPPELRRQLQDEFASDIVRLSEMLGRDLTHWSRD